MTTLTPPVDAPEQNTGTQAPGEVHAILAEFDNVNDVMHGAEVCRDQGYKHWDVYSPFPIHGIDGAMGIRPTILPWIVLVMGLTGMLVGLVLTVWTMSTETDLPIWFPFSYDGLSGYEYLISGKPLASIPAYIPVIFELTIMFAAYTAVFAMFLLNRLPKLYNPLFKSERFARATNDRFFIGIEARDPSFDADKTRAVLDSLNPISVETVEK